MEALRLTNQRLIGELEQLTRQMQRPREARQTQEGHNIPPREGQRNLDIPRGAETEAESSEPGGTDHNWPLGRRETEQHSEDVSGTKNYITLSKEQERNHGNRGSRASNSATVPGAQQLTLTSSSTLHRSRYLRSQISSGYIATRPQHPEPSSSL